MRKGVVFFVALLLIMWGGLFLAYSETIYTKGEIAEGKEGVSAKAGEIIQGKITEVAEDTVWIEVESGDIVEYIGVDRAQIEKILKDDGTPYEYLSAAKGENS